MATHDYVIDNSTGANVRADINSVLQAILTNNSNSSTPSSTAAYMFWADTTSGILKIRNSANNAWIELFQLDGTITFEDGSSTTPGLAARTDLNTGIYRSGNDLLNFATGGVERLELGTAATVFNDVGADVDFRIESDIKAAMFFVDAGNNRIGINTDAPSAILEILGTEMISLNGSGNDLNDGVKIVFRRVNGESGAIEVVKVNDNNTTDMIFKSRVSNSVGERMRITGGGAVGIGVSDPTETLHVAGNARVSKLLINDTAFHNSGKFALKGHSTGSHTAMRVTNSSGSQIMILRCDGYFQVSGALVKGSGSFKIDHPLPSLAKTKTLAHSFIEGARCDNIYRGKVTLSSGTAIVNIDSVSKMTEGTFVVLNRDIQCFTTNETSFSSVKGSVSGNILTITSEDTLSTDTISWMIVGERQDPNIKASEITDNDGYLIVEQEKVAA